MDRTNHTYTGLYYFFGIVLEVMEQDGELVAALPGVPAGYEIPLEPLGSDAFRMHGGPLDQGSVQFEIGPDGTAVRMRASNFELERIPPEKLAELDVTERMLAPIFELTAKKEAAFSALLSEIHTRSDGREVDYDLPYPKHEFIQYLIQQDEFIFHGSGKGDIEQFEPVRSSFELYDPDGRGNLQAVYGTHDGLWSMFFAVVDRGRLKGTIRNGVMYFHNRDGDQLAVYNFSINKENLPERPYRSGMLYLLPREPFKRLLFGEEALANEWASEQPVRPLARMRIDPQDFPFLDQIGGHDDGPLVEMEAMTSRIKKAVSEVAQPGEHAMVLTFEDVADLSAGMPGYIELMGTIMPGMALDYDPGPPARLSITDIPPAYRQVLIKDLPIKTKDG